MGGDNKRLAGCFSPAGATHSATDSATQRDLPSQRHRQTGRVVCFDLTGDPDNGGACQGDPSPKLHNIDPSIFSFFSQRPPAAPFAS